jgi:indole-3-glycerol phosphate synthase
MAVDLNTTGRLASLLDGPKGLVAESGIKTPEHVEKLKQSGATAVLIGQTLCEHPDIAEQFKRLFG